MDKTGKQRIINTLSNCENIDNATNYYEEILQIRPSFEKNPQLKKLTDLLNVFGNHDRFLLLNSLISQDRCVCELEAILGKTQPAVSHHLKLLEKVNLIRGWKKGKFTHYSLVEKTFIEFESLWHAWILGIKNWFG